MCNERKNIYENYIFDFEKMEIYKLSLKFVSSAFKIYKKIAKEYQYSIGAQFTRSALSIVNNIAEGSGKKSRKWKVQFYNIALDSARECIPMITLLLTEQEIVKQECKDLRLTCIHICNMLGKLIQSLKIEK